MEHVKDSWKTALGEIQRVLSTKTVVGGGSSHQGQGFPLPFTS